MSADKNMICRFRNDNMVSFDVPATTRAPSVASRETSSTLISLMGCQQAKQPRRKRGWPRHWLCHMAPSKYGVLISCSAQLRTAFDELKAPARSARASGCLRCNFRVRADETLELHIFHIC